MPSINVDLDYFDHPKLQALMSMLGPSAETIPLKLWIATARFHCNDGIWPNGATADIERRCGWRGQPGKCLEALAQARILEITEAGIEAHDWLEYQGREIGLC